MWKSSIFLVIFALSMPKNSSAKTVHPKDGEELQKMLNEAKEGDTIKLLTGTEYKGDFVLPDKNATKVTTLEVIHNISQNPYLFILKI